ncbi:DNA-binding protein [Peribacillus muralis]|uniref:DNA-binding protein n=1 Tax=Peribacillus muralis TaxID=264697 RepID=A0A1B3XMI9_9BACI|nr:helix-turn-helix domain-containing protein [Peribacillus muralis]AOH54444.1 DNA-binding protein [Peribacillus muralis]
MEKNLELPPVLTAKDIQIFLSVSKGKAYEIFKLKDFPTLVIGGSKRVLKDDFLNWIEQQKGRVN